MTENNELVTIKKAGQPTLRISREALAEHVKLGWKHVADEPKSEPVKILETVKSEDADPKSDTKLTLKK